MIYLVFVLAFIVVFETCVIIEQAFWIDKLSLKYKDATAELKPIEVFDWDYTKESGWAR